VGLALAAGVVISAVAVGVVWSNRTLASGCVASAGGVTYPLDLEQASNATTIAAVGKRLAMPDHAVTVALAAALQESRLRNLSHGDRDSLGVFQQRPSQGWGTPAQVMTPRIAAASFYQHLVLVDGWAALSVTDAAQQVQHSAAPAAYAQWESEARGLAEALTGEISAGLVCRFPVPSGAVTSAFAPAITQELGSPNLGTALTSARGWTVASWLVGHASQYRLRSVSFAGRRWTAGTGLWASDPSATTVVQIVPTASTGGSS